MNDPITIWSALGILAAGVAAGTMNSVVGSGSLITFPTLLAAGYSPLVANQSNALGLVPGSLSGAIGYRAELEGQGPRTARLSIASLTGAVLGAALLITLPRSTFDGVVPVLVAIAVVLVAVQPPLRAWIDRRRPERDRDSAALTAGVFLTGVYGGYFGAAQGVILISLLSICLGETLQRVNGIKNVLAAIVNGSAALLFVVFGHIAYTPAGVLAVGATVGGIIGSRYGRRLPSEALRIIIIVVGIAAFVKLMVD